MTDADGSFKNFRYTIGDIEGFEPAKPTDDAVGDWLKSFFELEDVPCAIPATLNGQPITITGIKMTAVELDPESAVEVTPLELECDPYRREKGAT